MWSRKAEIWMIMMVLVPPPQDDCDIIGRLYIWLNTPLSSRLS